MAVQRPAHDGVAGLPREPLIVRTALQPPVEAPIAAASADPTSGVTPGNLTCVSAVVRDRVGVPVERGPAPGRLERAELLAQIDQQARALEERGVSWGSCVRACTAATENSERRVLSSSSC